MKRRSILRHRRTPKGTHLSSSLRSLHSFEMPASCGSYRLTRSSLESKSHPADCIYRVVTGSRGLPSALPAHLPQDACGLRRYEPVRTKWIAPLRGKLLTYPTRNFATLGPFICCASSVRGGVAHPLCASPRSSDYLIADRSVWRLVSEDSSIARGLSC